MRDVWKIGLVMALLASPAWAIYQSTFNEPLYAMNAQLVGQDGWTSTTGVTKIFTDVWHSGDPGGFGGTVQLLTPTGGATRNARHTLNAENPTGDVTVTIDFLGGMQGSAYGFVWEFKVMNAAGAADNAYWYGAIDTAIARVGSTTVSVPGTKADDGTVWTLKSVIHVTTGTTDYYYDKHDGNGEQFLTTLSGYTSASADVVHFGAINNYAAGNSWTAFDNLNIPEPATLVLLGLGGLLFWRRR